MHFFPRGFILFFEHATFEGSFSRMSLGANGITQATPTYFLIGFGEIFLEYYWNIFKKVFNFF
jgi:hypothetical protein